jgi:hypothetical protein
MVIKTTINFLQDRLDIVKKAAQEYDIPYKLLIKQCIICFVKQSQKSVFNEHALKYQEDNKKWRKVHFKMSREEYDVYFDCKKVLRWSFSLIVAAAIDQYLDYVINGNEEFNYNVGGYTKLCNLSKNYPVYVFSWKKTEKIDKIAQILKE